jgi:hypothetical protein
MNFFWLAGSLICFALMFYILHTWSKASCLLEQQREKLSKPRFEVYTDSTWGDGVRIGVKATKVPFPSFAEAQRSKSHLASLIALSGTTFKTYYLRTALIEDVMDTVAIAEAIEAAKDLAQRCNDYADERDRQMAMIAERVREANGR